VQLNYTWLETNESGIWQNISFLMHSGNEAWSNFTIQTIREGTVCWRIYANDTAGNVNVTPTLCFDVQQPSSAESPDLVVTEIIAPYQASVGERIIINWTVENQGDGTAIGAGENYWADGLYLSNDTVLDSSDIYQVSNWQWQQPLNAGANYTVSINYQIPDISSGNYYLLIKTDGWPSQVTPIHRMVVSMNQMKIITS